MRLCSPLEVNAEFILLCRQISRLGADRGLSRYLAPRAGRGYFRRTGLSSIPAQCSGTLCISFRVPQATGSPPSRMDEWDEEVCGMSNCASTDDDDDDVPSSRRSSVGKKADSTASPGSAQKSKDKDKNSVKSKSPPKKVVSCFICSQRKTANSRFCKRHLRLHDAMKVPSGEVWGAAVLWASDGQQGEVRAGPFGVRGKRPARALPKATRGLDAVQTDPWGRGRDNRPPGGRN